MNTPDREKIIKMMAILLGILLFVGFLAHMHKKNSLSLSDYAAQHPEWRSETAAESPDGEKAANNAEEAEEADDGTAEKFPNAAGDTNKASADTPSEMLIGETLNGTENYLQREIYTDGFYIEPLSENLKRYITGISYFETDAFDAAISESHTSDVDISESHTSDVDISESHASSADAENAAPNSCGLYYAHVLYMDFEGTPKPGELICDRRIARDLIEIFYELYRNEYRIKKVRLIEEYDGDPSKAMAENNSFCLAVPSDDPGDSISALLKEQGSGLQVVINPLQNPLVLPAASSDTESCIIPENGRQYADRSLNFSYKISEDDLCCKLFLQHGFVWGGNRNDGKAYCLFKYPTAVSDPTQP